ncbi:unnamed protein product, partial [Rotaria magnacalcarata]
GGAGTGKSHLLKCLHYEATRIFSRKKHLVPDENIDEIHTLITAFTGAAAVNVGGVTIHSAFGIGTQSNRINDHLSSDKLNSYRCKLHSLKLLFVDEVSLIQASLWGAMHSRLTQIMGIHSNTAIFGNVAIIAIGDFYQCSPVAATGIYSSLLWSDHFEYIELKINERQKTNLSFSQMLNRIRKLKKKEILTNEDRDMLEKCHQRYLTKEYHPEALHLFPKNVQVDAHNEQMIEKVCTNIRTFYETDNKNKEIKQNEFKSIKKTNKQLRLAKNARVMIIKNICANDGLANGVTGRIVDYVENNESQVCHIKIKCDSTKVGRLHRISCPNCHGQDTICVIRESDTIDQQDADFRSKRGVKQFPLRLSWAMTIHKAQGITVDQVAISTKDMFGTGMGYTALSRTVKILGDGNCFFRAISHQLHRHERDHKVIRSQAIKYLTENKSEFSQFIDQTYATIDNYIKQMTKHGTYADHIAITATAVIINKNIIIHELHKKPILVPGSDFIDSQLHICYYPNKLHYDSVLCIDNNLAFLPFQDLLNTY